MSPARAVSDTYSGQAKVSSTVIRKLASRFVQRSTPAVQRRIDAEAFAECRRAKVVMNEITGWQLVAQGGGKAWKRRVDEELLREMYAAQSDSGSKHGTPEYVDLPVAAAQVVNEPPKKKQKTIAAVNGDTSGTSTPANETVSKKKEKEKPVAVPKAQTPPPPVPAQPRLRDLPCVICQSVAGVRLECAACRLTVHKACYGVEDSRLANKWYCDTCKNDKKESVSYVSHMNRYFNIGIY